MDEPLEEEQGSVKEVSGDFGAAVWFAPGTERKDDYRHYCRTGHDSFHVSEIHRFEQLGDCRGTCRLLRVLRQSWVRGLDRDRLEEQGR